MRLPWHKKPILTQSAVLRLFDNEVEVYRADLPMEIAEDDDGLYPFLAELDKTFSEGKVTWNRIKVEMRYRRGEPGCPS